MTRSKRRKATRKKPRQLAKIDWNDFTDTQKRSAFSALVGIAIGGLIERALSGKPLDPLTDPIPEAFLGEGI